MGPTTRYKFRSYIASTIKSSIFEKHENNHTNNYKSTERNIGTGSLLIDNNGIHKTKTELTTPLQFCCFLFYRENNCIDKQPMQPLLKFPSSICPTSENELGRLQSSIQAQFSAKTLNG